MQGKKISSINVLHGTRTGTYVNNINLSKKMSTLRSFLRWKQRLYHRWYWLGTYFYNGICRRQEHIWKGINPSVLLLLLLLLIVLCFFVFCLAVSNDHSWYSLLFRSIKRRSGNPVAEELSLANSFAPIPKAERSWSPPRRNRNW